MLTLLYFFTFFLLAFTDTFTETNHIITLGDPTFQHAIVQFPKALFVYYYSPYCEPCRKFWPEYDKVAQSLFDHHSEVKLAKIDCHDEVVLCDKHNVKHFPTLLLYRLGSDAYEYIGGLNSGSIHEWIWKVVDSVYQAIDDEDTLFDRHSAAILIKDPRQGEISEAYKDYPDEIELATPTEILQLKVGNPSQSIIYTMGKNVIPIGDLDNLKKIKDKINDVLYVGKLAVPTYNGKTAKKLQAEGDQTLVLFFKTESVTPSSESSKAFSTVAFEARNGGPLFYYVNVVDCRLGESVAKLFGVDERDEPTVGIIAKKGNVYEKYKLNQTADSADNIRDFVKYFEIGHLQRYYMSADIPAEDEHQHIRELVTRNYDDVTRDTSLNVFVMLYFPWCEACVKVEPTLTSLAYRMRYMENLVFARIDMSKNDLEGFDFVDYPVFLFYPAGEKKVIQYLEEPRMKYLQDFLEGYVPGLKKDIEL